jgi:hypothetical protein
MILNNRAINCGEYLQFQSGDIDLQARQVREPIHHITRQVPGRRNTREYELEGINSCLCSVRIADCKLVIFRNSGDGCGCWVQAEEPIAWKRDL